MRSPARQSLPVLAAGIGLALLWPSAASAKTPAWVEEPPAGDARFVYAVGTGRGTTRADAEKAAQADALGKFAAEVAVTVSARTISTISTRETENGAFSETRSSARGLVRDAEAVGAPWVEVSRRGLPPFSRKRDYIVKVLLRWSRASLERERQRQTSVWRDYRAALDNLAKPLAAAMTKAGLSDRVIVGGFIEATTQKPYAFSQVLKRDLGDALVRAGLTVAPAQRAAAAIAGTYRVVGAEVIVTAQVMRLQTRERVGVSDVALDRAMIEPAWLENSSPVEPFFESLEPERVDTRTRVGAISVRSESDGAQIFVDGEARGRTPAAFGGIRAGQRSLTVIADDHEPFIRQVQVVEGETITVDAVLPPKVGALEVRSSPGGAEVLVNGRSQGKTPLRLPDLRLGTYSLALRLKGYEDASVQAGIEHRTTTITSVTMVENPGSVLVISEPPGARVLLDGVAVGITSAPKFLKLERVPTGTHHVSVVKKGVGVWDGQVTIRANQTTTVNAELKSNVGTLTLFSEPPTVAVMIDGVLLAGFPGLERPACGRGDLMTLCNGTVSLEAGKHQVEFSARGYQREIRTVRIRGGGQSKLRVRLTEGGEQFRNGPGSNLFARAMPNTKGFADACERDGSEECTALTEVILLPVSIILDTITLPFRALALPLKLTRSIPRVAGEQSVAGMGASRSRDGGALRDSSGPQGLSSADGQGDERALDDQIATIDRLLIAMNEFARINGTPIETETRKEQQAVVDELKDLRAELDRSRLSQAQVERALVRLDILQERTKKAFGP